MLASASLQSPCQYEYETIYEAKDFDLKYFTLIRLRCSCPTYSICEIDTAVTEPF